MSESGRMIGVRPVLSYPRRARPGGEYLFSLDLQTEPTASWPYDEEEYPVYCMLETLPLFEHRPMGGGAVVLHRFGGTYGPARFLLTACEVEMQGTIRVSLVNVAGELMQVLDLEGIRVGPDEVAAEPASSRVSLRPRETLASRDEPTAPQRTPYRGLEPFTEADSDLYFGFEDLVDRAARALRDEPVVFIEGDPGTGKTSMIQAGILPRIRKGLLGDEDWEIVSFRPGEDPVQNFARALGGSLPVVPGITEIRPTGGRPSLIGRLVALLDAYSRHPGAEAILVVLDQFEEFYTRCRDEAGRATVLNALGELLRTRGREGSFRLLVGIRSRDTRLQAARDLGPVRWQTVVALPHRRRLAEVIVSPAHRLGYRLEPGLLDRILRDPILDRRTSPDEGLAPIALLELALHRLELRAARWNSRYLTHSDFEVVGLGPALAEYAEEVFLRDLPRSPLGEIRAGDLTRRIFWGLASDDQRAPRRRAELEEETGDPAGAAQVIEQMLASRLISLLAGEPGDEGPRLVLANRPLLVQHWPRLRHWLDEGRPEPIGRTAEPPVVPPVAHGDTPPILPQDVSVSLPLVLLPFDKDGHCIDTRSLESVMKAVTSGDTYTDIVVFVHGWNVDWRSAVDLNQHFFAGFLAQHERYREEHGDAGPELSPLFLGLIWESAVFPLPWERGPLAGETAAPADEAEEDRREVEQIARDLDTPDASRLHELVGRETPLSRREGLDLAHILVPLYRRPEASGPSDRPPSPEELLEGWEARRRRQLGDFPWSSGQVEGASEEVMPFRSGALQFRDILRLTTFWLMKERAERVGRNGVARLLFDLAANGRFPHLVGHSFGARVLLSALCEGDVPRAGSLLLLQPAVSAYCFAPDVDGHGREGEFRKALDRVELPILTTYSGNDLALTRFYHLAMAVTEPHRFLTLEAAREPPGPLAALGGFGPRGCRQGECKVVSMKSPFERYELLGPRAPRILALDGGKSIQNHSDISNRAIWWALSNLVRPQDRR